jgi:hypothetical protein
VFSLFEIVNYGKYAAVSLLNTGNVGGLFGVDGVFSKDAFNWQLANEH